MSVKLSDLRAVTGVIEIEGLAREVQLRSVTAAEVASACPTEVLIEVLVERGVLTIDHNVKWDDLGLVVEVRVVSDWTPGEPVAGGVS